MASFVIKTKRQAVPHLLRQRASYLGATVWERSGSTGRRRARGSGSRLRPGRPQPRLPAKKVVKCNGGSGLLRDLPLIRNIFESVRSAVTIPFTVKFRAGWSDKEIVHINLARMAEDCGLAAVALHARTREQGYSGQANWDWIAAVKDAVKIPVIGNGDVRSPEDAAAMVAQNWLRRGDDRSQRRVESWIFRQIEQYTPHRILRLAQRCRPLRNDPYLLPPCWWTRR